MPGLPKAVGVSTVNPPCLYWAKPVFDSVYWTKATAAGVGVPTIVMSITCGLPFLTFPPVIVTVAFLYSGASAKLPRLMAAGQLDIGQMQLDGLGNERTGSVKLARLQRGVERRLAEDLRGSRRIAWPAKDLRHRTGGEVVIRLGQLEHEDEVAALRVDIGVCATELEPWLLHKRKEVAQGFLATGEGGELAGVLALRVVGDDDRRAGVLHVPFVNFGSSGVMLSPPTLSNTFGVISPEAMSDSRSPEAPPRPENV